MSIDLKVDLADPKSIRKAYETATARLSEVQAAVDQLLEEERRIEAQPLNRSEVLELHRMQVDRAAAWWHRQVSTQVRASAFSGLVSGQLGGSQLADEPAYGEPFVLGLTRGSAAYCFLMPEAVIAGFERAVDEMPEVVPGPDYTDRLRTLAHLQGRRLELQTEAESLHGWIAAIAPLVTVGEQQAGLIERLAARLSF